MIIVRAGYKPARTIRDLRGLTQQKREAQALMSNTG